MLLFVVNFCTTTFALVFLFWIFITTKNENGKTKIHYTPKVPNASGQDRRHTRCSCTTVEIWKRQAGSVLVPAMRFDAVLWACHPVNEAAPRRPKSSKTPPKPLIHPRCINPCAPPSALSTPSVPFLIPSPPVLPPPPDGVPHAPSTRSRPL